MLGNMLGIVLLIALSAFFSGTETAYATASELRLRKAAEHGGKRQKWAYAIHQQFENALTTILIGNNLVNIAASSIATVIVVSLLGNGYAWVSTLVMTLLVLTFGEIVPKVLAKQAAEPFATAVSVPLRILMWITHPIVVVVQAFMRLLSRLWKDKMPQGPAVTEGDIEVLLDTAEDEGAIDENTTDLLQSALDFDDVLAQEIITPRVDMFAIDVDDDPQAILMQVMRSPYSRIPVYAESKDNIIGVLSQNRYLKQRTLGEVDRTALTGLLMPVCFVSRTAPLPAVLATMRQRKCHLVVIGDEFGGTLGILTMEDVLEELVGEIWDETDIVVQEFEPLSDGRFAVSGDMRMHDFFEHLDMDDRNFDAGSTTVGGWACEMLGATPKAGDGFAYENLRITVGAVQKRRVTRVMVEIASPVPETGNRQTP